MTNIRCKGGKEIDLLAMNPITGEKHHIESRVSTTFRLREKATKKENGTSHKDGLDYFKKEKFDHEMVIARIKELFGDLNYNRVLVVHGTEEPTDSFIQKAFQKFGIHVLLMKDIIADLTEEVKIKGSRDDIMRFVELIAFEERKRLRESLKMIENAVRKKLRFYPKSELRTLLKTIKRMSKREGIDSISKHEKKTSTRILREKHEDNA
jgi:hypothetical protein